jgi:hypothetical protein
MKRVAILTVLLVVAACTPSAEDGTTTTQESTTTVPSVQPIGLRPLSPFADFPDIPLLIDETSYAGPATPTSLDDVLWADRVPDNARNLLAEHGFVVYESGIGQFHEAYSHIDMYGRQPLFVTTDAAYHYWHLAFSKALRDTEQLVLLPLLTDFAAGFAAGAESRADARAGTDVEADAEKVLGFGRLLQALLGSDTASAPVTEEVALIRDHVSFATSPVLGIEVDYSLFGPRGHYTRTPELTRYFVAMSMLGQYGFRLADPAELRTGLLIADVIASDPDLTSLWRDIYEPTAFLVGLADDFTPAEVVAAADDVDPAWREGPIDNEFLANVAERLTASREVAIDPERASVRVMGARFVLDSYILDQLVFPNVIGADGTGRLRASVLDLAAAFGSGWAEDLQTAAGIPDDYPTYSTQMQRMQGLVSGRATADWATTVYDAWLHAIAPMWTTRGAAYPDFMRSDAWTAKAHTTGFGSYAELKHDTLLYAKQAFAEGEIPPVPAEPRHWVEPEPVVFGRLAAVAGLMRDGLETRGLLADDVGDILDRLIDMYDRFGRLARDELDGVTISPEDNEWLETIASRFELIWLLAGEDVNETGAQTGGSGEEMAAIIADVMSNPSEAMEIGTGLIDQIFVLVPNDDGVFQVARGAVYSFYEFWVPRGERLTDEEWRQMLGERTQPERPAWTTASLTGWDG